MLIVTKPFAAIPETKRTRNQSARSTLGSAYVMALSSHLLPTCSLRTRCAQVLFGSYSAL
ncbi:hypothetical protein BDY21DRAFT_339906, partial [Lineolata rhizophorae]